MKSLWDFLSIITSYMILRKWILRCALQKTQGLGRVGWVWLSLWGVVLVEAVGVRLRLLRFCRFLRWCALPFPLPERIHIRSDRACSCREDVGAWQTLERELCAVGAAADWLNDRSDVGVFHCLFCHLDDVHHWFNLFAHVVVLVFDFD